MLRVYIYILQFWTYVKRSFFWRKWINRELRNNKWKLNNNKKRKENIKIIKFKFAYEAIEKEIL
jgi:hypothetical protein